MLRRCNKLKREQETGARTRPQRAVHGIHVSISRNTSGRTSLQRVGTGGRTELKMKEPVAVCTHTF